MTINEAGRNKGKQCANMAMDGRKHCRTHWEKYQDTALDDHYVERERDGKWTKEDLDFIAEEDDGTRIVAGKRVRKRKQHVDSEEEDAWFLEAQQEEEEDNEPQSEEESCQQNVRMRLRSLGKHRKVVNLASSDEEEEDEEEEEEEEELWEPEPKKKKRRNDRSKRVSHRSSSSRQSTQETLSSMKHTLNLILTLAEGLGQEIRKLESRL